MVFKKTYAFSLIFSSFLIFAYIVRVMDADVLLRDEYDIPSHLFYAMRLIQTDPSCFEWAYRCTWFNTLSFEHNFGPSLLAFLTYVITFEWFSMLVTDANLIYLHGIVGVLTLPMIYVFGRTFWDVKTGMWLMILYSTLPVHIGFSAIIPYYEITSYSAFLGGVAVLHIIANNLRHAKPAGRYIFIYALTQFIYIGTTTGFPVGLAAHGLFIILTTIHDRSFPFWRFLKSVLLHPATWAFILFPITITIGFYVFQDGPDKIGSFARVISGSSGAINSYSFLSLSKNLLQELGPVFFIGLICGAYITVRHSLVIRKNHLYLWLVLTFLIFAVLLFLSGRANVTSYVLILSIPVLAALVLSARQSKHVHFILGILTAINLIFAIPVVYHPLGLKSGLHTLGTRPQHDSGLRALAYLIRTDTLPVTRYVSGNPDDYDALNLVMRFHGAWSYLGAAHYDTHSYIHMPDVDKDARHPDFDAMTRADVLVYRPVIKDNYWNERILSFIQRKNISPDIIIQDGDTPVMHIFSKDDLPSGLPRVIDTADYAAKFSDEFGNMEKLVPFPAFGREPFTK